MCFHDIVADIEETTGTLHPDARRELIATLMRCYNDGVRANAIASADATD